IGYTHLLLFFFSSRRRHTRLQGDWSSDVCSSDLGTHSSEARAPERWIPAFAAITVVVLLFLGFCGAAVAADRSSDRQILHILDRSEERRVGKECISRGAKGS